MTIRTQREKIEKLEIEIKILKNNFEIFTHNYIRKIELYPKNQKLLQIERLINTAKSNWSHCDSNHLKRCLFELVKKKEDLDEVEILILMTKKITDFKNEYGLTTKPF